MQIITKQILVQKILDYLNRKMTLQELVNWAEDGMMEGEISEENFDVIRDIIAALGLADVQVFGLSWDDCYEYLFKLGYRANVSAVA
ncbi:hypothetical protein FJZ31_42900 [Candidatus Poribacteria bacterium]|nr:hypothetical protein [Candidatus Poribacteria bacterium]